MHLNGDLHLLLTIQILTEGTDIFHLFAPSYPNCTLLPTLPQLHPFLLPFGVICQVLVKVYIKGKKKRKRKEEENEIKKGRGVCGTFWKSVYLLIKNEIK